MANVITESDLRALPGLPEAGTYLVPPGAVLTPAARDYLTTRRIRPIPAEGGDPPAAPPGGNGFPYIDDVTGRRYREKPEHMTHLAGNRLVPKTHPRIRLRGGLDKLGAEVTRCQAVAHREGCRETCEALGEVLGRVREILAAEVKGSFLEPKPLFGLADRELRRLSHNAGEITGRGHPTPDYRMGEIAMELNVLRTVAREVELLAAQAFPDGSRTDLIQALNRLSSGIYILFCRHISEEGGRGDG